MGRRAECPICKKKQSIKNKTCGCGYDLNKGKKQNKVKYHFYYRTPSGKQIQKLAGNSIESLKLREAEHELKKIKGYLDPEDQNATFSDLIMWYLDLRNVKKLRTYKDIKSVTSILNSFFGSMKVNKLKRSQIEDYQGLREDLGRAPATIDKEIRMFKTIIKRADDDDKINPRILKAFKSIEKKLIKGGNARERIISISEYISLLNHSSEQYKNILITAYNTGMRAGEIRQLKWNHYDNKKEVISVPPELTKEKRAKDKIVPVNVNVKNVLNNIIRCTHHDYIFAQKNKNPFPAERLYRSFASVCKKAKIPYGRKIQNGATFHDIRRSVKTFMLEAGVKDAYRSILLGHALEGMDRHYIKPTLDTLKLEMDKYTTWLNWKMTGNADQLADQKAKNP